ncbi:hypothetical protein PMAYCL1PPCAC_12655, partial [Pristionchus mayeri]
LLIPLLLLSSLIGGVFSQCGTVSESICKEWVAAGFCSSSLYSKVQIAASCGEACNMCECNGDANPQCPKWVADGFCTNDQYSKSFKRENCCESCATEIDPPPATDCAVVFNSLKNVGTLKPQAPKDSPKQILATVTRAYIKRGCSLTLTITNSTAGTTVVTTLAGEDTYESVPYRGTVKTKFLMLSRLLLLIPLFIVVVNGQCTAGRTDHFRCSIWVAAGFCNQTFYSDAQKQSYCGTACALCPT